MIVIDLIDNLQNGLYILLILELNAAEKAWDCEFLEKLNEMNVNLTDYLNTKNGPQITEEIRVVTTDTKWIKASKEHQV